MVSHVTYDIAYDLAGQIEGIDGVSSAKLGDNDPADPPEISDDDSDYEGVYLNRLLSGLYTPGSVFKVVTTAAALEQLPGVEERTFTCNGSVTIGDQVITCPYAHGEMDLSDAFARSCNGVYAQLAVELGADRQRYPHGLRAVHRRERRRSGLVRRGAV